MKQKKNVVPVPLRVIQWMFPKLERVAPSLAHRYFIHLFYTPFRYKPPAKEVEFMTSAEEFSVTVNDKHVQCYRWGKSGPLIIMVHGWAGRAGQFRKMIPEFLSAGFRVVSFDGPAHGKSEGKQTNLIDFREALEKIVSLEGTPHGMLAHSFGGVAALYAIFNGLNVARLINIASPTIAAQVIGNYERALNASPQAGQAFNDHLRSKYGKTFEEFSSLHFLSHLPADRPLKLLAIQDENDPEVAVVNVAELLRVYPSATAIFTQGLGHNRILKDEKVISACIEFFRP